MDLQGDEAGESRHTTSVLRVSPACRLQARSAEDRVIGASTATRSQVHMRLEESWRRWVAGCLVGLCGCIANVAEENDPLLEPAEEVSDAEYESDELGLAVQPLAPPSSRPRDSHAAIYAWDSNNSTGLGSLGVAMQPASSHVCFLSMATGNFEEPSALAVHRSQKIIAGKGPKIEGDQNGVSPYWWLGAWQTRSVAGEAICVPRSDFIMAPGGTTRLSTIGWVHMNEALPDCSSHRSTAMWNQDAVSWVSGFSGSMRSHSDRVETIWGDGTYRLNVRIHNCDMLDGTAFSFAAGIPGQFDGARTYGPYQLTTDAFTREVRKKLIKTKDGVCYFTRLAGNFESRKGRVRIYPKVEANGLEYWYAEAVAGGGSADIAVGCMAYDQVPGELL
jgi:hypothetical protein